MLDDKARSSRESFGNFVMKKRIIFAGCLAGIVGYLVALAYTSLQSLSTPWPELILLVIAIVFKVITQKVYVCWLVPWIVRKFKNNNMKTYSKKILTEREIIQNNILLKTIYEAAAASTGAAILLSKAGWDVWTILWACTAISFAIGYLEHWSDPMENVLRREMNQPTAKRSQQTKGKNNRKRR